MCHVGPCPAFAVHVPLLSDGMLCLERGRLQDWLSFSLAPLLFIFGRVFSIMLPPFLCILYEKDFPGVGQGLPCVTFESDALQDEDTLLDGRGQKCVVFYSRCGHEFHLSPAIDKYFGVRADGLTFDMLEHVISKFWKPSC